MAKFFVLEKFMGEREIKKQSKNFNDFSILI